MLLNSLTVFVEFFWGFSSDSLVGSVFVVVNHVF